MTLVEFQSRNDLHVHPVDSWSDRQREWLRFSIDSSDQTHFTMAEDRPLSFLSRFRHQRAPASFNSIPVAIIDPGIVKYVAVEIHSDKLKRFSKFIVRAFQPSTRVGDDVTSTDDLLDGPNDFVLLKLEAEMERVGVDFNVIGWGKLNHNVKNSTVTFFEEEDVVQEKFECHSQQCFIARDIVKTGHLGKGYVTYHVLKNGSHSPKSSQCLQRLKGAGKDVQPKIKP